MPPSATERPTIRAVQAGDGPIVRDVCMQMLLDAPEVFNATIAEVEGRSPSEWALFVERCAQGTDMSALPKMALACAVSFARTPLILASHQALWWLASCGRPRAGVEWAWVAN